MKVTCGHQIPDPPKPIEFNVGDEFKLNYRFPDKNFRHSRFIPLDKFDLTIEYYTKGRPERFIAIMKNGVAIQNCVVDRKFETLKVLFENHKLNPGFLFAKYIFQFKDKDFADNKATSIEVQFTNIVLVDNIY